ncbi:hypothetical protein ABT297_04035 [Dactylosporangium sp. NPDC000555]|uniref:hypothetical protein n=1 Tax=Dactylosporangium sp. NPDC000555 TaxID=3154260 RepID=UPI00331A17EE
MMFLVYKPEDGDAQRWTVQLGKLRSGEIEQIEKLTGFDFGTDYKTRLMRGNALARRALLFTMLRRAHPRTRFADVDFADDELTLEMDVAELTELRTAIEEADALSDDERKLAISQIDRQLAEAADEGREPEGKAPTPSSDVATG